MIGLLVVVMVISVCVTALVVSWFAVFSNKISFTASMVIILVSLLVVVGIALVGLLALAS